MEQQQGFPHTGEKQRIDGGGQNFPSNFDARYKQLRRGQLRIIPMYLIDSRGNCNRRVLHRTQQTEQDDGNFHLQHGQAHIAFEKQAFTQIDFHLAVAAGMACHAQACTDDKQKHLYDSNRAKGHLCFQVIAVLVKQDQYGEQNARQHPHRKRREAKRNGVQYTEQNHHIHQNRKKGLQSPIPSHCQHQYQQEDRQQLNHELPPVS